MPESVTVRDHEGRAYSVDPSQVAAYQAQGFTPESDEQHLGRVEEGINQDLYGGAAGALKAGAANVLSGATLGLSDVGIDALGGGHTLSALNKAHPYTAIGGQIAGAIIPSLLSGGAAAPEAGAGIAARLAARTPAGLTSSLGRSIVEHAAGEGAGLATRVGAHTLGAAAEGALYGGGGYLSQVALEDKPLSAEGFIGGMGHGALFAAPIGGALTLGGEALLRARALFPKREVTAAAAHGVQQDATAAIAQSVSDGDAMAAAAKRKLELINAKTEQAAAGEQVTRRMFGDADPAALGDQAAGGAEKAQIEEALQKYEASKVQFRDWVTSEADPDLEQALSGLLPPNVHVPGSTLPDLGGALPGVPVGEFGAPGASGKKSSEELAKAAAEAGVGETPGVATPSSFEAINAGRRPPASVSEVPEWSKIKAHESAHDADLSQTLPAKVIADHGYYEPPGGGVDSVRVDNAKKAIHEGQRSPIKLTVDKEGKILVTDGRHRLAAAIEANAPIKVEWSTGSSPAADDVARGAATSSGGDDLEALLRGMQDKLAAGEALPAMGAPSRAEYVATKAAKTREAADHFRSEALARRNVKAKTGAQAESLNPFYEPIYGDLDAFFKDLTTPRTRDAYVAANIGRAMREEGGHSAALDKVEREWADRAATEAWAERAAILEYEGGHSRADAERIAREEVLQSGPGHGSEPVRLNPKRVAAAKKAAAASVERRREIHSAVAGNLPDDLQAAWAKDGYKFLQEEATRIRGVKDPINAASRISESFTEKYGSASETSRGYEGDRFHRRAGIEAKHAESWATEQERKHYAKVSEAADNLREQVAERVAQPESSADRTTTFDIRDSNLRFDPKKRSYFDASGEAMDIPPSGEMRLGLEPRIEPVDKTTVRSAGKSAAEELRHGVDKPPGSLDDLMKLFGFEGSPPELPPDVAGILEEHGLVGSGKSNTVVDRGMKAKIAEHRSIGKTIVDSEMRGKMSGIRDDLAIAKALAKAGVRPTDDIGPQLARAAKALGDHEDALSGLVTVVGMEAPPSAAEHAAAFKAARAAQADASAATTAKAATAAAGKIPPAAVASGALGAAADVGTALELLRALGVRTPVLSAIPVIGPILGLFLKARAVMRVLGRKGGGVEKTTEGLIASKAAAVRDRISSAINTILTVGGKGMKSAATFAAGPAVTLATKLFPGGQKPASRDPQDLYSARMDEISRAQQPGAIDQAISDRYHMADAELHDAIVAQTARGIAFLDSKAPKQMTMPGVLPGGDKWRPSKAALESFGRYVHAVNDPASVLEDLAHGHVTLEGAETLRVVYPALFAEAQRVLIEAAPKMTETLPYPRRVSISIMFQVPIDGTMSQSHVQYLQGANAARSAGPNGPQPQGGPTAGPAISGPLKTSQHTLTSLDRRGV